MHRSDNRTTAVCGSLHSSQKCVDSGIGFVLAGPLRPNPHKPPARPPSAALAHPLSSPLQVDFELVLRRPIETAALIRQWYSCRPVIRDNSQLEPRSAENVRCLRDAMASAFYWKRSGPCHFFGLFFLNSWPRCGEDSVERISAG